MKVEFIIDSPIDSGRIMVIQDVDFLKAAKDRTELNNLIFAVSAFNSYFDVAVSLNYMEFKDIEKQLVKGGAVIFSVTDNGDPHVYVSNKGILKRVEFSPRIHTRIAAQKSE